MAWIIENELGDCWSNAYGWVDGQDGDYDSFTDEEHESLSLPLGGHWVQVPWKVDVLMPIKPETSPSDLIGHYPTKDE